MQTLMNDDDRAALVQRLRRLRPEARGAWGSLDAPRMLCHVADQMRVALGDLDSVPRHSLLMRTLVKVIVVHTRLEPPPGKIRTAPEMLISKPGAWESDLASCEQLAARVGTGAARAVHPSFGPLTPEEWGKLCWKHLHHHLRQFNV